MKIPFTIEMSYGCECKACGHPVTGSAWKWVYLKLFLHLKFKCKERSASKELPLIKTLWDLWKLPS